MTRVRVWGRGLTLDAARANAWQSLGAAIGARVGEKVGERYNLVEIKVEVDANKTGSRVKGLFDFEERLMF